MTREQLEALLDDEFIEDPLVEAGDLRWRPAFGSPDGNLVVHVNETSDLGRSVRQRIDLVVQSGRRVATVLPKGPSTLDVESQRFLLHRKVEVITVDPLQERGWIAYGDLARSVVDQDILLDGRLAADVVAARLADARITTGVTRGERLEEALALGCSQVPGWRVRDIRLRTDNEELDIVVANSSARAPWNGSAYILFEAKNWSSNVDRAEYDAFHMKVVERGGACRIGFFVAAAGFSSGFYKRAEHFGTHGVSIVPMSLPWLERHIAEEGIELALTSGVERVVLDRTWEEEES